MGNKCSPYTDGRDHPRFVDTVERGQKGIRPSLLTRFVLFLGLFGTSTITKRAEKLNTFCGGLASYLVISRGSKRRFQKAAVWNLPMFFCGLGVMTDFPKGAQIVFLLPMLCYVDKTGGSRPLVYRSTRPLRPDSSSKHTRSNITSSIHPYIRHEAWKTCALSDLVTLSRERAHTIYFWLHSLNEKQDSHVRIRDSCLDKTDRQPSTGMFAFRSDSLSVLPCSPRCRRDT